MDVSSFVSKIEDVEIRGCREQVFQPEGSDKEYRSLVVQFDQIIDRDTDHETVQTGLELTDKDVSRKADYKRGRMGTLYMRTTIEYKVKESKAGFSYAAETSKTLIDHFEPEDEA